MGFLPLIFVRGHFQEIGIAALPMGLKPRHVEKFQASRLTDVGESELTDEKHTQNGRSNNICTTGRISQGTRETSAKMKKWRLPTSCGSWNSAGKT